PDRWRYLQPTELKTLLEAALDWLRPIIALAAVTGMRRGEILGLRWLDIDLAGGRILLPQSKNGEGRVAYLNEAARTVLGSLPPGVHTEKPFPYRGDWVGLAFRQLTTYLGIENFRFMICAPRRRPGCECRVQTFTPWLRFLDTETCGWQHDIN